MLLCQPLAGNVRILFLPQQSCGAEAPNQWTEAFLFLQVLQGLLSALRTASAYLEVVAKLEHPGFGEAMTLGQAGSQHPLPGKLW